MRHLFILFTLPYLFSCNDSMDCCTNIDMNVSIKYINAEGQNLFEIGEYVESNVTIYHKIEGSWERYYEGNLDRPKGVWVDEREDGYYLTIFPSMATNSAGMSETKIQFSGSESDILQTEIDQNKNNMIVTRVWYNNTLKWEAYENERKFEIIK